MAGSKGEVEVSASDATMASIEEFMRGEDNRYMQGGMNDTASRGLFTPPADPQPPAERPAEAPTVQRPSQVAPAEQDWKKLYGESENVKGEWRKTAQEAQEELARMKAEMEALRFAMASGFNTQPGYATQVPQYTMPQYPQYAPPAAPTLAAHRFIPNKQEDDLVQVAEVERILNEQVAPAVQALYQQNMLLAQQQYANQKVSLGVTPQVEQEVLKVHPWLQGVPEGINKLQALATLARSMQRPTSSTAATQSQQPPPSEPTSPQQAARRHTFVESNTPSTTSNDTTAEQVFQAEFGKAMSQPIEGGGRRKALEDLLLRGGVGRAADWGPDVLGIKR